MRDYRTPSRRAGFSIIELILVIAMVAMLMLGLLEVFDRNSLLAKNQTQVAEMQQSLRTSQNLMTRLIRVTGRGGLPAMINDGGVRKLPAMTVRDNVGTGGEPVEVVNGLANGPIAVVGTDILTIRGVLTNPVFQINTVAGTMTLFDAAGVPTTDSAAAATGTLVVSSPSPTGRPQPLEGLNDVIGLGLAEALIIVSPVNEAVFAVVELDPGNSVAGAAQVTLAFNVAGGSHPGYRNLYASGLGVDPALPTNMTSAAWVGVLEEYRFYVRDDSPGDPMLSMARMFPGTEIPYGGAASAELDVAENVRELQVALGFDSSLGAALIDRNADGETDEDDILLTETANGEDDDWLFNAQADDPLAGVWMPPWDDDDSTPGIPPMPELYYVRLSTLARVRIPDREYLGPVVDAIEDSIPAPLNTRAERLHRRQLLQTIIDLRNL